ncbi:MAG TPA: STAS domain-containing protein [Solirubrobacterales bacterium]|nr:STAS domain-containing protein [Solirubrobacterales bacterium]
MTPVPFKVGSEQAAGAIVVKVEGELDMNTARQLERELTAALATTEQALLIDLSRCEFIDSSGIALIVRAWQERDGDGGFALCGVGDQVARVLDVTGLGSTIPSHPTRETALGELAN